MKNNKSKMYILVRDSVPLGFAMLVPAHESLAAYLKFQDAPEVQEWFPVSFTRLSAGLMSSSSTRPRSMMILLSLAESALEKQEVAMPFKLRVEWPTFFQFLRLYR